VLEDLQTIGEYDDPELILSKLQEMGDMNFTDNFKAEDKGIENLLNLFTSTQNQPWSYTAHQFGYIAPIQGVSTESQVISHPGAITPDVGLKNARINIRLDRLQIYKYPGGGNHNVMVTWAVRNQLADTQESVGFSQVYRVSEGQSAGIAGYPIFIGLNVGYQGVAIECSTVNVKNDADTAILNTLESLPFQSGLKLLTTAQPAITPFTAITLGIVKALSQRNQNVAVQKFYLGLDFEDSAMGIRLTEGNYIAAQVPNETALDWNKWIYKPNLGTIVHKADGSLLDYNYLVFRVSRYQE